MKEQEIDLIRALAECDMSVTRAAKRLYMHRNSVYHYARRIQEKTGKNPFTFYGLCDLLAIVGKTDEKE